jgi:DNA modification methylase
VKCIDQVVTDKFALFHGDTVDVSRALPSRSADLLVTSIPFSSLLTYSASERDFGNVRSDDQFWAQMGFLIPEIRRVMKPGRLVAVHCMTLPTSKERDGCIGLKDFPGDVIRNFQAHGFIYHSRICIWKCPVTAVTRTKALGLLYKQLRKDSAMSRQGIPDDVVVFRVPGGNEVPVTHTEASFPVERWQRYASPIWASAAVADDEGFMRCTAEELADDASSGINQSDTLNTREAKDERDQKHIAPLQLGVIRRMVKLWSNPGEVVWDPFMGIGSTGYVALQEGRRALGAELKASYFRTAAQNMAMAADSNQQSLFDP